MTGFWIKWWTKLKAGVKTLEFWLTFLAYAIPLGFLLYVLYINYLPFGYDKTFTIQVGAQGDTDASQPFYLEPSADLSDRQLDASGTPYRTLNGLAKAVFNPGVVLKNATVSVSVEGDDGIEIIPPHIDFDPTSVNWDYSWDFSTSTPSDLVGNAFHSDDCEYFDGQSKLELPNSADQFESGPFTVYAEWKPENSTDDFQEIVGHFNWEIIQNKDSVELRVGRMNNAVGNFYDIRYPIEKSFFNSEHNVLAIYSPSAKGYIELFVDGNWAGRTNFYSQKIWTGYSGKNLSFGDSAHSPAHPFKGCLYGIELTNNIPLIYSNKINLPNIHSENGLNFAIFSKNNSILKNILMYVSKN